MTARFQGDRRRRRAAFTLIELMIVIVIILVLIGILVPVVSGAVRTAREATVKTEITRLEAAISDFKAQYGIIPPSYIDFRLTGTPAQPPQRTQALLRRLWPNINPDWVNTIPGGPSGLQGRILEGESCLVFFLGGMYDGPKASFVGFSANPRSPFLTIGKRVGPFIEFDQARLIKDSESDAWIGYRDPFPGQLVPYYYITSDRYYAPEPPPAGTGVGPTVVPPLVGPIPAPKVCYYRDAAKKSGYNPQSFQIISAGVDGSTGYDPDGGLTAMQASAAPTSTREKVAVTGYNPGHWGAGGYFKVDATNGGLVSRTDDDNLTNFHQGKLYQ